MKAKTFSSLFIFSFLTFVFSCFLFFSWGRWGCLYIDSFRDHWIAREILAGKVLYRDMAYEFGFFTPYFLAAWAKVFSIQMYSLIWPTTLCAALTAFWVYKISRLFMDRIVSTLAALTFIVVFAFAQYTASGIFNFILPYCYASVFFTVFAMGALYYFMRFIMRSRDRDIWRWAILMAFAFFSRIELSLLCWLGFVFCGLLYFLKNHEYYRHRYIAIGILPIICAIAGYYLFLTHFNALADFCKLYTNNIGTMKNNIFTKTMMGTDNIHMSLHNIFVSIKTQFILTGALVVAIFTGTWQHHNQYIENNKTLISALILLFSFGYLTQFFRIDQYAAMPLILLFAVLILTILLVLGFSKQKEHYALLVLFTFALAMTIRIFFNATPTTYGFYLLIPSMIVYYLIFFKFLKNTLEKYWPKFPADLFRAVFFCFFLSFILAWSSLSIRTYADKKPLVDTSYGKLYRRHDVMSLRFVQIVDYILKNTKESDSVLVLPRGIAINYFTNRDIVGKDHGFIPPSFEMASEDTILNELSKKPADYIVLLPLRADEFGAPIFGVDYAKKIYAWVLSDYSVVQQFGTYPYTANDFGVAIFKRKSDNSAFK